MKNTCKSTKEIIWEICNKRLMWLSSENDDHAYLLLDFAMRYIIFTSCTSLLYLLCPHSRVFDLRIICWDLCILVVKDYLLRFMHSSDGVPSEVCIS